MTWWHTYCRSIMWCKNETAYPLCRFKCPRRPSPLLRCTGLNDARIRCLMWRPKIAWHLHDIHMRLCWYGLETVDTKLLHLALDCSWAKLIPLQGGHPQGSSRHNASHCHQATHRAVWSCLWSSIEGWGARGKHHLLHHLLLRCLTC